MNPLNDPHEDQLRDCLRELGRDTERHAPAFQRVWRVAQKSHERREPAWRPSSAGWGLATATAVVCAGAVFWMSNRPPQHRTVPQREVDTAAIAPGAIDTFDPTAPTDFLLTAANEPRTPSVAQLTKEIDALLKP
jgi:hypothetical protein